MRVHPKAPDIQTSKNYKNYRFYQTMGSQSIYPGVLYTCEGMAQLRYTDATY